MAFRERQVLTPSKVRAMPGFGFLRPDMGGEDRVVPQLKLSLVRTFMCIDQHWRAPRTCIKATKSGS